jgi:hypothetical protein
MKKALGYPKPLVYGKKALGYPNYGDLSMCQSWALSYYVPDVLGDVFLVERWVYQ